MAPIPRHRVLGIECFAGDAQAAVSLIVSRAASGEGGLAVLCNTHVLATAQREARLREALQRAWVVFPDGAPVAWLQRRTGAKAAQRIAGPDLMPAVMADGRRMGLRHFLFGSTESVLVRLSHELTTTIPGVEIVGSYAPPPGAEDSPEALAAVRAAEPDLVWVALGAPRQELWMLRNAGRVKALLLGVGAAFDFHAGTKKRAPVWLQELGLEWLHRFVSEPRRLGPRYLKTNTAFLFLALQELHAHRAHARMGT